MPVHNKLKFHMIFTLLAVFSSTTVGEEEDTDCLQKILHSQ